MKLRQTGDLEIDLRKLADYCLNPDHPRGRHKARVFARTLGIGRSDAPWLRDAILEFAGEAEAIQDEAGTFGTQWRADVALARQGRSVVVRTIWLQRAGWMRLQLVTCWVL